MRVTWDKFGNVLAGIQGGQHMDIQCDSDDVDPAEDLAIWFKPLNGKIQKRVKKQLNATLPYMLANSQDVSIITGFAAPAMLQVNNEVVNVNAVQYVLQNRSPGTYKIELKGNQLADVLFVEVLTQEELTVQVKADRDKLLKDSDWTQLADAPLTEDKKLEWQGYRQKLRDLLGPTLTTAKISWPSIPV